MTPASCVSVDMDSLWCYAAIHGLPEPPANAPDPIWEVALGRFLELFEATGVKATFFCVGRDLEDPRRAALARAAAEAGHELASHSHAHAYDLRSWPLPAIRDDLARAEAAIEAACGAPPVGFRTPGYNLSPDIAGLLVERGYLYDSSIFPCPPYYTAKGLIMAKMALGREPSRSQMTLPGTLTAPLTPYRADPDKPWRRAGRGPGLLEIPMALVPGVRFPIIGTSLHMLGQRGLRRLMPALRLAHPRLFNLEFHGIDMLDEADAVPAALTSRQPDLRVPMARKLATWHDAFEALADAGYTHQTLHAAAARLREHI